MSSNAIQKHSRAIALLDVSAFYPANGLNPLEAVRFGPTLEFNGIGGGYQGEVLRLLFKARPLLRLPADS